MAQVYIPNKQSFEEIPLVIGSNRGGYIIVGHDGIDIGFDRTSRTSRVSHNRIVIDGVDIRKLHADIDTLRAQMAALRPVADYARNTAAQKIQRAWRRYMYAPGTGKWFHVAHNDYRDRDRDRERDRERSRV